MILFELKNKLSLLTWPESVRKHKGPICLSKVIAVGYLFASVRLLIANRSEPSTISIAEQKF
jgi:hypothetical protein